MKRFPAEPRPLYDDEPKVLHRFLANEAFAITKALFTVALPWKIFGTKKNVSIPVFCVLAKLLSVFGILTKRVRIIVVMPIAVRVDLVDLMGQAPCCLHNFLFKARFYFDV